MHSRLLYDQLTPRVPAFLDDLQRLCSIDCGTANKAGVDQVGSWVRERCVEAGWKVQVHPRTIGGDIVEAIATGTGTRRVLLLAHMDTVYPDGTVAARPVHVDGDHIVGPATCDMKAGLLAGIYAVEALQALEYKPYAEVVLLFTADEEIGSPESRELIKATASRCDASLVLEAGRASGDIVGARKGIREYLIQVSGRAAHAGVAPGKGRSALLELAHKIVALQALNGELPDVTVNVGVAHGGTATNVVPESATAHVEARAFEPESLETIDQRIRSILATPTVPDTSIMVTCRIGFPPMPRTAATEQLTTMTQAIAAELGFSLQAVATGGGSDASLVASVGKPVLDGLGPVGGDSHSPLEWVAISSIAPRVAMLAGLIARVAETGVG